MTSLAPAYAHAFQKLCCGQRPGDGEQSNFMLLAPKTKTVGGETTAGWSAVARYPRGECNVMFGFVITAESHSAYAGAYHQTKQHSSPFWFC